jgi:hypothetical protein
MAKDATKGRVVVWRSEPVLCNILNKFVISNDGELGQVIAYKRGVGGCTLVVVFEHQVVLRYVAIDELVGWRVFDTKQERNRAQAKLLAENLRRCPAEFVGVAA